MSAFLCLLVGKMVISAPAASPSACADGHRRVRSAYFTRLTVRAWAFQRWP